MPIFAYYSDPVITYDDTGVDLPVPLLPPSSWVGLEASDWLPCRRHCWEGRRRRRPHAEAVGPRRGRPGSGGRRVCDRDEVRRRLFAPIPASHRRLNEKRACKIPASIKSNATRD